MHAFNVLLIDDSEADNYLHELVINEMGFADEVRSVPHGKAALEFLRSAASEGDPDEFPRLIFLDINMPVMDGWQFLKAFEAESGDWPDTVVVTMLSTSRDPRDLERSSAHASVRAYVSKPLTSDHVRDLLDQHFPDLEYEGGAPSRP